MVLVGHAFVCNYFDLCILTAMFFRISPWSSSLGWHSSTQGVCSNNVALGSQFQKDRRKQKLDNCERTPWRIHTYDLGFVKSILSSSITQKKLWAKITFVSHALEPKSLSHGCHADVFGRTDGRTIGWWPRGCPWLGCTVASFLKLPGVKQGAYARTHLPPLPSPSLWKSTLKNTHVWFRFR
jgi:hypothetical protein